LAAHLIVKIFYESWNRSCIKRLWGWNLFRFFSYFSRTSDTRDLRKKSV